VTGVASLRARREEKRGGNDAPWKAWKTQKAQASFPTLSIGLGNPAKSVPDFHIPTAPAAGPILKEEEKKR